MPENNILTHNTIAKNLGSTVSHLLRQINNCENNPQKSFTKVSRYTAYGCAIFTKFVYDVA